MQMPNDRLEIRKIFRKTVGVISPYWDEEVEYLCEDLSPRGAFLRTNFPLCPGENVVVVIRLPEINEEFNILAKVSRVEMPKRKSDWGNSGMALSFKGITARERFLLRQGLRKIPPPLPYHIRLKKIVNKAA